MDNEGKTRRKRKDPESRDFQCKCGKSYLSYAAAYTHAKNKHQDGKEFIEAIKKPEREQLKRGRPKEKKVSLKTAETAILTLIESVILKICEQLQGKFTKIILEGNEQRSEVEEQKLFRSLWNHYGEDLKEIKQDDRQVKQFIAMLNKDFNVEVAARVRLASIVISDRMDLLQQRSKMMDRLGLWSGPQVTETIAQALKKWWSLQGQQRIDDESGDLYS